MFRKANKRFLARITGFIGLGISDGRTPPRLSRYGRGLGLLLLGVMGVLIWSLSTHPSDAAGFAPLAMVTATATRASATGQGDRRRQRGVTWTPCTKGITAERLSRKNLSCS